MILEHDILPNQLLGQPLLLTRTTLAVSTAFEASNKFLEEPSRSADSFDHDYVLHCDGRRFPSVVCLVSLRVLSRSAIPNSVVYM